MLADVVDKSESYVRDSTLKIKEGKKRCEELQNLNSKQADRNSLLLQEVEELKDVCAASQIRCRKLESKKAFNHLMLEISGNKHEC
jgi:inhibitor of KinA sporulation pathway (predicted exonuclease)